MPRVRLKRADYKVADCTRWIAGRMYQLNLRQADVAEWLGITQQGFGYKLRRSAFTYREMLTLLDRLGATDSEILSLMKIS